MIVIKYKKIFLAVSGLLVVLSLFLVLFVGLNIGIDFRGGSILEVRYQDDSPSLEELRIAVASVESIESFSLRDSDEGRFILRTDFISDDQKKEILSAMTFGDNFEPLEERFSAVGPLIGDELKKKAWVAIAVAIVAIILFIAFAFRKVSVGLPIQGGVSSWKYGFAATIALAHDIIIPLGIFSLLGLFMGAEVDVLFVMALLAILGFSVNDTIVVFDRIRENLRLNQENNLKEDFSLTVGKSLNQTYVRSINTSLTTLLVLLTLFFLGGEVTKNFTLVLIAGVIVGTYSSIFLASPLLILMGNLKKGS